MRGRALVAGILACALAVAPLVHADAPSCGCTARSIVIGSSTTCTVAGGSEVAPLWSAGEGPVRISSPEGPHAFTVTVTGTGLGKAVIEWRPGFACAVLDVRASLLDGVYLPPAERVKPSSTPTATIVVIVAAAAVGLLVWWESRQPPAAPPPLR